MEKTQLSNLLIHYSGSSPQEAEGVGALSEKYAYSQVLHALTARFAKDHDWKNKQVLLQLAAVYSTDRSVLKEIMSGDYSAVTERSIPAKETVKPQPPVRTSSDDSIDYADEILVDLERLKELKANFELMFMGDEPIAERPAVTKEKIGTKEEAIIPKKKKTRKKTKRERLLELTKELQEKEESVKEKKASKKNDLSDPLIAEIKATKKKVQPATKTKEQIEIITQFIKSKPTISPSKTQSEENLDLASTLKSGEFGDNIISETLAEILIRQGKKDKAIEVYKKLIWKFPQKKAYFAAQIEDLRK